MKETKPACVECALEGRPDPQGPVPLDDEANPPIVSVDIAEAPVNDPTNIQHQYGVYLCGWHVGEAARILAEAGTLLSITVRARIVA